MPSVATATPGKGLHDGGSRHPPGGPAGRPRAVPAGGGDARRARPAIEAQSIADVIFHPIVSDPATANADTLEALVTVGQTTIKVFMVRPSFEQAVPGFMATLRAARDTGVLMMIHCEDAAIVQSTAEQFIAEARGLVPRRPLFDVLSSSCVVHAISWHGYQPLVC